MRSKSSTIIGPRVSRTVLNRGTKYRSQRTLSDQILQSVLPESLLDESPTSFTQVGHIGPSLLRAPALGHTDL